MNWQLSLTNNSSGARVPNMLHICLCININNKTSSKKISLIRTFDGSGRNSANQFDIFRAKDEYYYYFSSSLLHWRSYCWFEYNINLILQVIFLKLLYFQPHNTIRIVVYDTIIIATQIVRKCNNQHSHRTHSIRHLIYWQYNNNINKSKE